jgi:hypothetical protein
MPKLKSKNVKLLKYKMPDYVKNIQITDDETFPVRSYTYSMWSDMCCNPLYAKIKYINKDTIDSTNNASSVLGRVLHAGIMTFLGGDHDGSGVIADLPQNDRVLLGMEHMQNLVNNLSEGFIKFSKTIPDKATIYKKAAFMYNNYVPYLIAEKIEYEDIVCIEEKVEGSIYIEGVKLPIPIKGVMDLLYYNKKKELIVWDHKSATKFSDEDKLDGAKLIQTGFNFFLAYLKTGEFPKRMIYAEVKHTENKDKTIPQIAKIVFDYKENSNQIFELFFRLYRDITKMLCGEAMYLPNFRDIFNGDLALIAYMNGLDSDDREKIYKKSKVNNMTEFLQKEVQKKGIESKYAKTIESFTSETITIDYTNMKTEDIIKITLANHGIAVNYVDTISGLQVDTLRYSVGLGVAIKKIKSRLEDIELSVGISGIRVLSPIPDTTYLGFEIPKKNREYISSPAGGSGTNIEIGQDVYGNLIELDITKAPHILIGGSSGSGKTHFLKSIANQIIKDSECELIIIDPKMIDFQEYGNVYTDLEEIANVIVGLYETMENRYKQMKAQNLSSIGNVWKKKVVIVDEYTDLVMTKVGKEIIAHYIQKIAQKGRGAGIHIILATQRPSVKAINGDIKANFPIKIAFKLPKTQDSLVVLDEAGAEKLRGLGDGIITGIDSGTTRFQAFSNI